MNLIFFKRKQKIQTHTQFLHFKKMKYREMLLQTLCLFKLKHFENT